MRGQVDKMDNLIDKREKTIDLHLERGVQYHLPIMGMARPTGD